MSAVPREYRYDFLDAILDVFHIAYKRKSAEDIKVLLYICEHTIRWQEYETKKRISLDEFAHGRRRKDGGRTDEGCGVSRTHACDALHRLEHDGHISWETEENDRARIRKSYGLNLPSIQKCSPIGNTTTTDEPVNVPQRGTQSSPMRNIAFPNEEHSVPPEGTRSVVNTSVNTFKKITLEKAADAASLNEEEIKKEEEETQTPPPQEQEETEQQPPSQETAPAPPASIDRRAAYYGQLIKGKAREEMKEDGYEASYWHLSPAEGESLEDGVLTFCISSYPSAASMLDRRFGAMLRRIAWGVLGEKTDVRFVYRPEVQP